MCGLPHARRDVYGRRLRADHQFARPDRCTKELGAEMLSGLSRGRFIAWQEIKKKAQEIMPPGAQRELIDGDVGGATNTQITDHHEARQQYWRLHGTETTPRTDQRYLSVIADENRSHWSGRV